MISPSQRAEAQWLSGISKTIMRIGKFHPQLLSKREAPVWAGTAFPSLPRAAELGKKPRKETIGMQPQAVLL